jgi:hypothetical protein
MLQSNDLVENAGRKFHGIPTRDLNITIGAKEPPQTPLPGVLRLLVVTLGKVVVLPSAVNTTPNAYRRTDAVTILRERWVSSLTTFWRNINRRFSM